MAPRTTPPRRLLLATMALVGLTGTVMIRLLRVPTPLLPRPYLEAAASAPPPTPVRAGDALGASSRRAFVTMATGDSAARMALALVQSLRDVGADASIEIAVLLFPGGIPSPDCSPWQAAHNRSHRECSAVGSLPEEIISSRYVDAFRALGAKVAVLDAIPRTPFTVDIAGGTTSFWGMALNKLVVFKLLQYEKIVYLDGDTLVLRNIDHLFAQPTFTSSITHDCCVRNAAVWPGGGVWVLAPALDLWARLVTAMEEGAPVFDPHSGVPVLDEGGVQRRATWEDGDLAIVRHVFSRFNHAVIDMNRLWPWIADSRHGHVEGLRAMPWYRNHSEAQLAHSMWEDVEGHLYYPNPGKQGDPRREGFIGGDGWDGVAPTWHALSAEYDQFIVDCVCLPSRHTPHRKRPEDGAETGYFTVHFTCMRGGSIEKPSEYADEHAFWSAVSTAHNCYLYYYSLWYGGFDRAVGGGGGGPPRR